MYIINERDNVAVATQGDKAGHKFALRDIKRGEQIIKYGYPIGRASEDIKSGEWVHTHNLKTGLGDIINYTYSPVPTPDAKGSDTFFGYERKDGRVGVRNELWIIPTVGCVCDVAREIASRTGAYAFTHPYGCSQLSDDHENTKKILADLIRHPNAGGVLVLGLGCENNRISELKKLLCGYDE